MKQINSLEILSKAIEETNQFFINRIQKQVNVAMTMRNWIIGCHIIEYEQSGKDRAKYGNKVLETLAIRLKKKGIKGLAETNLKLFRQFYNTYPQIRQTASDELNPFDLQSINIGQIPFDQSLSQQEAKSNISLLINSLSFSHFIELLKADTDNKRRFYETQTIKNNWGVRDLKRAIESLLYERTGLSSDKEATLKKHIVQNDVKPDDVFRNTYLLEFLGLEEKPSYSESDLEESIITNLQNFLIEMGRGFCFEARQKRITFDNRHYRIDLVFYHRILKCHCLADLKLGEFDHSDAGQMNMYLNYYKENESANGDNDPIGIILCSGKNEALVKYATMGLPQQVFVSKYLINLPSEKELQKIIEEEKEKRL
ncbi:MAG TPA: PDDEXK nuclease domain-containing protein [Hanamia sp.]|nr:PDDEXK nuclease domain-containing protein [Hanamia sp.]